MNRRTRIKICGLTREEDVQAAVTAGADAIGIVFYPASRRYVTPERAARLRALVPAFVDVVALFVNPDPAFVQEVLRTVQPDLLQFHGDESPVFCERFGARYLKAFRVGAPAQETSPALARHCQRYRSAAAWLFDSYSAAYGGSGRTFDAGLLHDVKRLSSAPEIVLAGGLTPDAVAARIRDVQPYGVDVSSGVETGPGLKSPDMIRAFIRAVQAADAAPA